MTGLGCPAGTCIAGCHETATPPCMGGTWHITLIHVNIRNVTEAHAPALRLQVVPFPHVAVRLQRVRLQRWVSGDLSLYGFVDGDNRYCPRTSGISPRVHGDVQPIKSTSI
eukprot:9475428-Pyramimonas_sp.AAC.1